jgi:hypothetical protein
MLDAVGRRASSRVVNRMKLSLIIVGTILALGQQPALAATDEPAGIQTNFVSGAALSGGDLDAVVKLATLCGIDHVSGVSTERHLSGISIMVTGDEKIDGRKVLFKRLLIYRDGWPPVKRPSDASRSIGRFWVDVSARPQGEERTIVQVGNRTLRVGLLNGIKPAGADKVIEAFLSGRIRYASDALREQVSGIDFAQPSWLGISGGESWISFSAPGPLTDLVFRLTGNEVTILDVSHRYE